MVVHYVLFLLGKKFGAIKVMVGWYLLLSLPCHDVSLSPGGLLSDFNPTSKAVFLSAPRLIILRAHACIWVTASSAHACSHT